MLASALGAVLPFSVFVFSPMLRGDRDGRALALGKPQKRKAAGSCVTDSIRRCSRRVAHKTCGMCRRCKACSSRRKPGVAPAWWWVPIVDLLCRLVIAELGSIYRDEGPCHLAVLPGAGQMR